MRASHGFDLQFAYTHAKTISDSDVLAGGGPAGQTTYNRKLEKAIADTDVPNIVSFGYSYELPFYKQNRIIGGWIFSGINQYSTGVPLVLSVNNTLPLFNQTLRPNAVAGVQRQLGTYPQWINPAAFSVPAAYTFGTAARSYEDLRASNYYNENIALMKRIHIVERVTLTFRAEFFNVLNRVVFGAPTTNASNGNFGRITSQSNNPRQGQLSLRLEF